MNIFIDPAYKAYYQDELFNAQNRILNRDDTLSPFIRMRKSLEERNVTVKTADYLINNSDDSIRGDYYSFGVLDNFEALFKRKNIKLKSFIVLEPPVVSPELYSILPRLTKKFESVYLHNTIGDGYSLKGVETSKLKKLYWPQPYNNVIESYWSRLERKRRIVVINGNHKPKSYTEELYSNRIEVISQLKNLNFVDLYGRHWEKWWSRSSMWLPYWKNRKALMSVYKGSCTSKLDVLSQYDFCLCFENMYMNSYITEKIFDCFYAGTVPIYMGAKNIDELITPAAFIDFKKFSNIKELTNYLACITPQELHDFRMAAYYFIQSDEGMKYYDSVRNIIDPLSVQEVALC